MFWRSNGIQSSNVTVCGRKDFDRQIEIDQNTRSQRDAPRFTGVQLPRSASVCGGVGRYTKIAADSWGRAVCLSKRDGILHRDWFGSVRGVGGGWAGRGLEGHNPRRGVEQTEVGERMSARERGVNGTPHGLWCAAVMWTLAAKRCVEVK